MTDLQKDNNHFEALFSHSMRTLEVYGVVSSFLLIVAFNSASTAIKLANNTSKSVPFNVPPLDGIIFLILLPLGLLSFVIMLCYIGKEKLFGIESERIIVTSRYLYILSLLLIILAIAFTGYELYSISSNWMANLR